MAFSVRGMRALGGVLSPLVLFPLVLFVVVSAFAAPASADSLAGDNQGCAVDQPCFTANYQNCHDVVFGFDGVKGWDLYNVRYKTPDGETQVENKSGQFTIHNAKPNATYSLKVQGCTTHFLSHSTCSPWSEAAVSTVGDFGPDTCRESYVWRGATPADHVCVKSDVRDDTAKQNAQAAANRQPGGGAFGPDTCKQGFVWREATPTDHVCVKPEIRDATRGYNANAAKRKLCG